ncbi:MAG: YetF domain-containing protein [Steroidobacteraceae bacterium]
MNFGGIFAVHMPVTEIILRGSVIYWFLFLVFRFVLRRDVGSLGIADVLLLVIVADASQNALAGEYKTVSEGLILLSTICGWNYLFDWLSYRYRWFARFTEPPTMLLIRHGRFVTKNLRKAMLTPDETMSKLREQGIAHLRDVRHAYMESDGQISAIRYDNVPAPPPNNGVFGGGG